MSRELTANKNKVALYKDNNWKSEVDGFYPFHTIVTRASRVIKAPVEIGTLAADTKVLDPIVVKITGKIDRLYSDSYIAQGSGAAVELAELADLKSDKFVSVRTPEGFYKNLIVETVESKGSTKEFDLVECTVTLVEMLILQGSGYTNAMSPDNDSLSRRGYINS